MQQGLAPVAQLFGESTDQLMSELSSGKTSLSALASQKGISQTDLIDAIKQGLQQNAPSGQTPSDSQLTNMANRIANHKHGGGHHHGGGGGVSAAGSSSDIDPLTGLPVSSSSSSTSTSTSSGSTTTTADSSALQLMQLLEGQSQTQGAFDQSL